MGTVHICYSHMHKPYSHPKDFLFRMLLKLTLGKKNNNDLTIKALPEEVTKF